MLDSRIAAPNSSYASDGTSIILLKFNRFSIVFTNLSLHDEIHLSYPNIILFSATFEKSPPSTKTDHIMLDSRIVAPNSSCGSEGMSKILLKFIRFSIVFTYLSLRDEIHLS